LNLPRELSGSAENVRRAWPAWLRAHDQDIRSRLVRGEEDTLVNFVLFGVSFTTRPRTAPENMASAQTSRLISERIDDFLKALEAPNTDRLRSLQSLTARLGYDSRQPGQRDRLRQYVSDSVSRYLAEWREYQATLNRSLRNDAASSSTSASLYKNRGLSTDTDFRPDFAIEQALSEVKRRGLLK